MRVLNVLRNSIYALLSFLLISLLGVVVRKFFTVYLTVELLGLEGLFSSIIAMLSLAELGISSIISYGLYRELANHNEDEINILMNIYKKIYSYIGTFVLVIGVIIFFLLPYIIIDTELPWGYVQFAYCIQMGTVLSSYFLAYKRVLLIADQKDYICIKVDTICNGLNNIIRLFAIIQFNSYILYSASSLIFNIIANLVIAYHIKQKYSFLNEVKVDIEEIKKRNFFRDIKNLMIQKVCLFVYGSSSAIMLSGLAGLTVTGLFANYQLIIGGIFQIMYKALQGIIPSVGNMLYEGDDNKTLKVFWTLDFFYLLLAGYMAMVISVFIQPFMKLFFGEVFLLSETMVFLWSLWVFSMIQFENLNNFRNVVGEFGKDRSWIIMTAVVKLLVGIPAIYFFGASGLVLSCLLSWYCIGGGRLKIVFGYVIKGQSKLKYLIKHFYWSLVQMLMIACIYVVNDKAKYVNDYWEIVGSLLTATIMMTVLDIITFYYTKEFKWLLSYFNSAINIIVAKVR